MVMNIQEVDVIEVAVPRDRSIKVKDGESFENHQKLIKLSPLMKHYTYMNILTKFGNPLNYRPVMTA